MRIRTRSVNPGKKFHYRVLRAWPKIVKYITRISAQPPVIALMICGTFANDRRLVSPTRRYAERRFDGEGGGRKRKSGRRNAIAQLQLIPRVRPREIQGTRVLFGTKIIATERREAAGSIRAVYNRQLKLALQQVILVHAVYPRYPREPTEIPNSGWERRITRLKL